MKRVVISYRRSDCPEQANRLFHYLVEALGHHRVLMDLDETDQSGDFGLRIDRRLADADILIVLIGPHWSRERRSGHWHSSIYDDAVHLEIATALRRGMRVIPVLLDGAALPDRDYLPHELAGLTRLVMARIDSASFADDAGRLISAFLWDLAPEMRAARPTAVPWDMAAPMPGASSVVTGRHMRHVAVAVVTAAALAASYVGYRIVAQRTQTGDQRRVFLEWPPPPASAAYSVPSEVLFTWTARTMLDVARFLQGRLHDAGYRDLRWFYLDGGGIAVATRVERIRADGKPDTPRFSHAVDVRDIFALANGKASFFHAPVGRFRFMLITVSPQPPYVDSKKRTMAEIYGLIEGGGYDVSREFGAVPFRDEAVTILYYEVETRAEDPPKLVVQSDIDRHLQGCGLSLTEHATFWPVYWPR